MFHFVLQFQKKCQSRLNKWLRFQEKSDDGGAGYQMYIKANHVNRTNKQKINIRYDKSGEFCRAKFFAIKSRTMRATFLRHEELKLLKIWPAKAINSIHSRNRERG